MELHAKRGPKNFLRHLQVSLVINTEKKFMVLKKIRTRNISSVFAFGKQSRFVCLFDVHWWQFFSLIYVHNFLKVV